MSLQILLPLRGLPAGSYVIVVAGLASDSSRTPGNPTPPGTHSPLTAAIPRVETHERHAMSRYAFRAGAAAAGGFFTRPFNEPLPVQAASFLMPVGGYGSARSGAVPLSRDHFVQGRRTRR